MLIHLLYTIKALTRHITPPLSLEHQCLCCWEETDLIGTINHLVFTQSQKVSAPRILKCSVPCTVTVCLQLSAVKTFFFGHRNLAFAPLLSRLQLTPHWQKGQRSPLPPPCSDVISLAQVTPLQQRVLSERVHWGFRIPARRWGT